MFVKVSVWTLALLCCAPGAYAGMVAFSGAAGASPRVATLDETNESGVPYVSLISITEQLGGGYSLLPTRLRVDLAGSTAWVQVNDRRVNAVRIFSLSHPIVRKNGDVLIATSDVIPFFAKGLRVVLSESSPPVAPAQVNTRPSPPVPATSPVSTGRPIRVIVIDPGHGGFDLGVEGAANTSEKELTLDIATRLEQALSARAPQRLLLTRRADVALNNRQRALLAAKAQGDFLLALHVGSSPSPRVRGTAVFYPPDKPPLRSGDENPSRRAAAHFETALKGFEALPFRGALPAPIRPVSDSGMPGVVVELGCLTNPDDASALSASATRQDLAEALSDAILAFLGIAPANPAEKTALRSGASEW